MKLARVLDVGNCDPDHAAISRLIVNNFEADVDRVMFPAQAIAKLKAGTYELVLVNRRIFDDDSDGLAVVTEMHEHGFSTTPVMMISNYTDAQDRAVAEGAKRGFGKSAVRSPETVELLAQYLPRKNAAVPS